MSPAAFTPTSRNLTSNQPWENNQLAVSMDPACEDAIKERYEDDRTSVTL